MTNKDKPDNLTLAIAAMLELAKLIEIDRNDGYLGELERKLKRQLRRSIASCEESFRGAPNLRDMIISVKISDCYQKLAETTQCIKSFLAELKRGQEIDGGVWMEFLVRRQNRAKSIVDS